MKASPAPCGVYDLDPECGKDFHAIRSAAKEPALAESNDHAPQFLSQQKPPRTIFASSSSDGIPRDWLQLRFIRNE